jgi:hypothetical protein
MWHGGDGCDIEFDRVQKFHLKQKVPLVIFWIIDAENFLKHHMVDLVKSNVNVFHGFSKLAYLRGLSFSILGRELQC